MPLVTYFRDVRYSNSSVPRTFVSDKIMSCTNNKPLIDEEFQDECLGSIFFNFMYDRQPLTLYKVI